jgi:hypothetical protein
VSTNAANGRGTCAACNYAKEAAGWRANGRFDHSGCHTVHLVTPTGSTYASKAPPLPGTYRLILSETEINFAFDVGDFGHAA